MDNHTFLGKRKIGSTEICDFTDYQGIGRDPLYKRYQSVNSIIRSFVDSRYSHFLATPDYSSSEDRVNWYIEEWNETPERLVELEGEKREKYANIKQQTLSHYKRVAETLTGEELHILTCVLRYVHDEFIYCCDDKVYLVAWGMTPDENKHIPRGELVHESPVVTKYKLTFDAGEFGSFSRKIDSQISLPEGSKITEKDLPAISTVEGYRFKGWTPEPLGKIVDSDMSFTAEYEEIPQEISLPPVPPIPPLAKCRFKAAPNGQILGNDVVEKPVGSKLLASEIPAVNPQKGYEFKGWDKNPENFIVLGDTTFNAAIEKKLPWYKRFWAWLTGKGCLKWLLWLLLALLIFLLLALLLKGCHGCTRATNGVVVPERIVTAIGDTIDDNGYITPIELKDGRLPNAQAIVAPIYNDDGSLPPIIREPGVPPVIANRLFLFLENDNANIDEFAADFKKVYPGDAYSIIGYDRDVKSLLIQVPESEKDEIRQTINSRLPNYQFIVFDEEIYELNGHQSSSSLSSPGWHLKAVNAEEGWKITEGDSSVVVAVIDDGIDASHPIFKDRIVDAYNVFTQNNRLSAGVGHGTHTAGLAVGSTQYLSQGAAGIAPKCKLMPVQVFDNGICPLSALVSGVMYSVHKRADVVNISVGPTFEGLNQLPLEVQNQIARTQFKNVEKLWQRVCKLAADKNTILVFAAGNDDILSSIPPENRTSVAITVGAVDQRLYPTDFTNFGECTDISAPGSEIYSSFPVKDFRNYDGTSMAAPIVTGTIALMKSLKKDLTVKEAYNVLYNTGKDVFGPMPPMVQVNLALEAVRRGDFHEPQKRVYKRIPAGEVAVIDGGAPASWYDGGQIEIIEAPVSSVIIDESEVLPVNDNSDDYESIRRLIEMYKQKIIELEGQLPENKK